MGTFQQKLLTGVNKGDDDDDDDDYDDDDNEQATVARCSLQDHKANLRRATQKKCTHAFVTFVRDGLNTSKERVSRRLESSQLLLKSLEKISILALNQLVMKISWKPLRILRMAKHLGRMNVIPSSLSFNTLNYSVPISSQQPIAPESFNFKFQCVYNSTCMHVGWDHVTMEPMYS